MHPLIILLVIFGSVPIIISYILGFLILHMLHKRGESKIKSYFKSCISTVICWNLSMLAVSFLGYYYLYNIYPDPPTSDSYGAEVGFVVAGMAVGWIAMLLYAIIAAIVLWLKKPHSIPIINEMT